MTEMEIRRFGESAVVYEDVRAGLDTWPDGFWAPTNLSRRISEILNCVFKGKLKIEDYETAKAMLTADFIDEYELSVLFEKAERPPEMQEGEFFYILWYLFPNKKMTQDELTLKVYHEVLDGKRKTFPRGYFLRYGNVEQKALVCFKHLCEDILKLDREGICRTFCNSEGIKVLFKYKLKIILNLVYPSLSHLMQAAYPEYAGDLERYQKDRRLRGNKES